jgi:dTDP-4-amino-4,6-dideoxygalactose transaminase
MNNLNAAIGRVQLSRQAELAEKRRSIARHYDDFFDTNPLVTTLPYDYDEQVPHIYVIVLKNSDTRDSVRMQLRENDIGTAIHWHPNHLLSKFRLKQHSQLLQTEDVYSRILTIPLHPNLSKHDLTRVTENIALALKTV